MAALDRPLPPDRAAHWPDVRLLLQGLRARAARAPRPQGGTGGEIRWT
jgi:hypothetical protein